LDKCRLTGNKEVSFELIVSKRLLESHVFSQLDTFFARNLEYRELFMAKVDIYTKAYCPFCTHAIALLEHKLAVHPSLQVDEINIGGDMMLREKMIERSNGGYTVPQIFIDDVHVGGCDQLVALEMNQQLDAMLTNN